MVDFPVEGLDMLPHMDSEKHFPNDFPGVARSKSGDHLYDLYAVCNHLGSMSAGHYIAVSKSAYLLFYVRRLSGVSQAAQLFSSSPVSPEHWLFNVPNVSLRSSESSLQDSERNNQTGRFINLIFKFNKID